jgi:hypothetical protein
MTPRGRKSIAQQAQRAQRLRRPGFYVVNGRTGLAVAGPFESEELAVREASRQNAAQDAPPDRFDASVLRHPASEVHE